MFFKHTMFYVALLASSLIMSSCEKKTASDSGSEKFDYVKSFAAVQSGDLKPGMETVLLVKIKEGLRSGETTYAALKTTELDIEILTAKSLIRTKQDCIEKMSKLDPNSEAYKAYQFVVSSIDKDHPHLVEPASYK